MVSNTRDYGFSAVLSKAVPLEKRTSLRLFGTDLHLQMEFNHASPFLYMQGERLMNYSHTQEALAHPYGAYFDEAVAIFREQAAGLLEGGVDLFVIETMLDIQEARAALLARRRAEFADRYLTPALDEARRLGLDHADVIALIAAKDQP